MDVDTVLQNDPFASMPKSFYDIATSMDHNFVHCTGILAMLASARNMDFLADWDRRMTQGERAGVLSSESDTRLFK